MGNKNAKINLKNPAEIMDVPPQLAPVTGASSPGFSLLRQTEKFG